MELVATSLFDLVSEVIRDTKGIGGWKEIAADSSVGLFLPEIVLCGTILTMLVVRLFRISEKLDMFYVGFVGLVASLLILSPWRLTENPELFARRELFTGMLVYDGFSVFMRGLLFGFGILFLIFAKISGIPSKYDSADIYTLVLGATLGLCLMSAANHLLVVFMGIEMASVPSYALAGMQKRNRQASEAALKFAVYGAGAAGIMLYGISLLAGLFHTVHLPTLAWQISNHLPQMETSELMVAALAGLMIMAGLAYKLSAFPFHYWIPDVFEGAPAEIGAFLSIASKAAALALLVRVVVGVGTLPADVAKSMADTKAVAEASEVMEGTVWISHEEPAHVHGHGESHERSGSPSDKPADEAKVISPGLKAARTYMAKLIALIAILTCTFGNLAAYGQNNIKRMLAYSTIAHAGFMMMAVPGLLAVAERAPDVAASAVSGIAIYLVIYLFMNLGAFAIVAFLRNAMGSEQIDDYAGLLKSCPGITICFVIILFSLIGLPPLAGFIAKFAVLAAVADAFRISGDGYLMWVLVVGVLNTAISLIYYLRVARVMTMLPEPESRTPVSLPLFSAAGCYVLLMTIPVALFIVRWGSLHQTASAAVDYLLGP